jgi:hypothetical protein
MLFPRAFLWALCGAIVGGKAGKTGGFCNTFPHKNGSKTDTRRMRTRVNPVILYERTVILGVKKSLSQLRILKKKISSQKKCLDELGKKVVFTTHKENLSNLFQKSAFDF